MSRLFVFSFFLFVITGLSIECWAVEYSVKKSQAQLFDKPNGKAIGKIRRGARIKTDSEEQNGFLKLSTKSGRVVWIKSSDVEERVEDMSDDVAVDEGRQKRRDSPSSEEKSYSKLTYDVGFSTGRTGSTSYSEANLGLNYFFMNWLAWRNALFARFVTPENIYGLDSSVRLSYTLGSESMRLTVFGGPGYRFASKGDSVPFAEAGLDTRLAGFRLGAGVKTFFTSAVRSGAETDTQYFFTLSGGGAL